MEKDIFEKIIEDHNKAIESLVGQSDKVELLTKEIVETIKSGGTVFIAGNGGSASDSQHFAAELVGRFQKERKPYASVCLNTDTSILTAVGNDYGYEQVIARQLVGLGKKGDLFIPISTSGNSKNLIEAINQTKERGIKYFALLGGHGGALKQICDNSITIEAEKTAHIQEAHITLIHAVCKFVEDELGESENY